RQAQYLSTINLSEGPEWSYSFKTLPRPKGRATKVVYTEYELPQKTRQPHDVIVDSQGLAWYASFGEMILGKLDPKTGKVTDYEVPRLKRTCPRAAWPFVLTKTKTSGSGCSSRVAWLNSIRRRKN